MTLLIAIAFGVLVGGGLHLMLKGDAFKLAAGTLLLTNSAILLLVATGRGGNEAPLLPVDDPRHVADPLVQALALTAAVIGFGTTVLLLRVALAVERSHGSLLVHDLVAAEVAHGEDEGSPAEEGPAAAEEERG